MKEVYLRKPQRLVFNKMKEYKGCFLRKHKKRLNATREYFRLLSSDRSPIINYRYSQIKPMIDEGIFNQHAPGEYSLRSDVKLIEKKPKVVI